MSCGEYTRVFTTESQRTQSSDIAKYAVEGALPAPFDKTLVLAETPTRLAAIKDDLQERLINWGYAITDAAMRKHVDPKLKPLGAFPYPRGVSG